MRTMTVYLPLCKQDILIAYQRSLLRILRYATSVQKDTLYLQRASLYANSIYFDTAHIGCYAYTSTCCDHATAAVYHG